MSEPPDGAALRRQWDALCDETRAVVEAARQRARAAGDDGVGKYLDRQLAAISSIQASADGRRMVPGRSGTGLMHDIPPGLPEYEDAYNALNRLVDFWSEGMHLPGWNWRSRVIRPAGPLAWVIGYGRGCSTALADQFLL